MIFAMEQNEHLRKKAGCKVNDAHRQRPHDKPSCLTRTANSDGSHGLQGTGTGTGGVGMAKGGGLGMAPLPKKGGKQAITLRPIALLERKKAGQLQP